MLALRLQRTGRKKVSHYRVIAQEQRFQPTSGKVTAFLGHYNPHTKEAELDTEQIEKYLASGAQPSDAAAKLFKAQGVKLPEWVSIHQYKDKKVKTDEPTKETEEKEVVDSKEETTDDTTDKANSAKDKTDDQDETVDESDDKSSDQKDTHDTEANSDDKK